MANRPHFASVQTVAAPESGNNTETVVGTLVGVIPETASQLVKILAAGQVTLGASSLSGTFRIRRASLTGTLVSPANGVVVFGTAAAIVNFICTGEDTPGEGNFTYVLTYQGTGDTGVATVQPSEITARWD